MKTYFAYVRVSTARQGEEGVSLQEQRRAILEYASRRNIAVAEWFEEQVSAAKRGRPVFTRMVARLKVLRSAGLIIHKIDRGSRNLRDWADIGELMDRGIELHFAHESIDLHTRSGRLSADILAVVAADYIRNLRDEVVKGINGRLRQGIFPFAAPIGYLNNGSGKAKTVDPVRGPLVKLAFELYATRQYSLQRLEEELFERGLRTKSGKRTYLSQLATLLRNPFYMGLIRLRNRSETFAGAHAPLITSSLFNQVQLIIDGKRSRLRQKNRFLLQLLVRCESCRLNVVAERHKGHVYYRCHRRTCPQTCIREERFEAAIVEALKRISISPDEEPAVAEALKNFRQNECEFAESLRRGAEAELEQVQASIRTLLQRFLDDVIPKETFDQGHGTLLMEKKACEERLERSRSGRSAGLELERSIQALRSICPSYCTGSLEQKRTIIRETFLSILTSGNELRLALTPAMEQVSGRERSREGWDRLLPVLAKELALK
jgi:site-specific DNA recombinase